MIDLSKFPRQVRKKAELLREEAVKQISVQQRNATQHQQCKEAEDRIAERATHQNRRRP